MSISQIRARTWQLVELARPNDRISRVIDTFVITLVFLNILAVIIETVAEIQERFGDALIWFENFSILVFTIEYLARLWSCISAEKYRHPIKGRLLLARQPLVLIDLISILPFYLPLLGFDLRFMRILRLLRLFRIAKIGRYYSSLNLIGKVIRARQEELTLCAVVLTLVLIVESCLVYYFENPIQPEKFPDIPTTIWWAVVTITTIGYGDVVPVTIAGKICTAITAVLGIGILALPAGVIGAGFVEEIRFNARVPSVCPHCGESLGLRQEKTHSGNHEA